MQVLTRHHPTLQTLQISAHLDIDTGHSIEPLNSSPNLTAFVRIDDTQYEEDFSSSEITARDSFFDWNAAR